MTPDPLEALELALGRRPPEALAPLPAETLDLLADAVYEARDLQARALEASLDGALRLAPLPIRGLVRKMLT